MGAVKSWSLILHLFEIGMASKTAEFDEKILFDIKPIPPILHRRLRLGLRPKWELMFSVCLDEVQKFMSSAPRFGMDAAFRSAPVQAEAWGPVRRGEGSRSNFKRCQSQ